jgi:hypothetical protein
MISTRVNARLRFIGFADPPENYGSSLGSNGFVPSSAGFALVLPPVIVGNGLANFRVEGVFRALDITSERRI